MTMSTTAAGSAWMDLGACREAEPELFFPISSAGPARSQVAAAKLVCARCVVREECLEYALDAGQDHGVWGGLSEEERRAVRRARTAPLTG
jgi:WhiB family transcriptional regulator, redox-sensing transcriptional regulator